MKRESQDPLHTRRSCSRTRNNQTSWLIKASLLHRRGHLGCQRAIIEERPFLAYELAQGRDYSEATASRIDQEVQHLLEESHEAARCLLADARQQLDRLVQALTEAETVDQESLVRILGSRPEPAQGVSG